MTPGFWAENKDPEIMNRMLTFDTTILRALATHGAIKLALKHPDVAERLRPLLEDVCRNLASAMEDAGLPSPLGGWDAEINEQGEIGPPAGPYSRS